MLFRAGAGIAIAFFAHDAGAARHWLDEALLDRVEQRCAEGLPICGGEALEGIGRSVSQWFDSGRPG